MGEEGWGEGTATDDNEAKVGWGMAVRVDEIVELGGNEGGDGDAFVLTPLGEGLGVPFLVEASEGGASEAGTKDEPKATDVDFGEGESESVFGGNIEGLVDGEGGPFEGVIREGDPFFDPTRAGGAEKSMVV